MQLPLDEFLDLNDGNDRKRQSQGDEILSQGNMRESESGSEKGNVDYSGGAEKGEQHSAPQEQILRLDGKDGVTERTHIERMKNLRHR